MSCRRLAPAVSERGGEGGAPPRPADTRRRPPARGVRPTKKLGQNFVHDPNTVRRIVKEAHLTPDDVVIEVGPGPASPTPRLPRAAPPAPAGARGAPPRPLPRPPPPPPPPAPPPPRRRVAPALAAKHPETVPERAPLLLDR